ncbi:MAG: DM13 domain-containing protein [Pseudomonadota bacterium]|nr:DM13 domain-containing protein [Pseudomonadota bacterium]
MIAEKGLDSASIVALSDSALRRATFVPNLPGPDELHWGDGVIMVNADRIWLDGKLAPGPDYRLYLTPKYVETGPGFQTIKVQSMQIRTIKTFENFSLGLSDGVDVTNYQAVLIWCEAFGKFITAAELQ